MPRWGHVYLVGAGPGPVDLLTVRAMRLIQSADVLAYDDLVHPDLLQLAPAHCEILAIGYRAGQTEDRPPPLHPLVLERAKSGLTVVRLKAGDPMIFARGGEEALALTEAGIPYTFVPGITAALAAASSCSLPLTWRGRSAELRITTATPVSQVKNIKPTLALYMPRHGLRAYLENLMREGWSSETPAAFVMAAAQTRELCLRSTLKLLADEVESQGCDRPGLVLIGASLQTELPLQRRPGALQGLPVMLAKAHADNSRIGQKLRELGADVWEWPWIKAEKVAAEPKLRALLQSASVILVPHAQLWTSFVEQLKSLELDLRSLHKIALWTLSESASRAVKDNGLLPEREFTSLDSVRMHAVNLPEASLFLSYEDELGQASTALFEQNYRVTRCVVARKQVQYPRLPQVKPEILVIPHQKALRMLCDGPQALSDFWGMETYCFGESLRETLMEKGWKEERIHVVKSIDGLLHEVMEPKPLRTDEESYESGTADFVHGTWQG